MAAIGLLTAGARLQLEYRIACGAASETSLEEHLRRSNIRLGREPFRLKGHPKGFDVTTRGAHKPGTDLVTGRMLGRVCDNALARREFLGMAA